MNKVKVAQILSVIAISTALFSGCGSTKAPTQQNSVEQSKVILAENNWSNNNYKRLCQVIKDYGINGPKRLKDVKPYIVVDWDYTSITQDVEKATLMYQGRNLIFKMTPEEMKIAITKDIPKSNFKKDFNNADGKPVNVDMIASDVVDDYTYLYNNYKGLKGTKSLEEVSKTKEYKDFVVKLRYMYNAIGKTHPSKLYQPWVTYLLTGMTSKDIHDMSEKAIDFALKEKLSNVTEESPRDMKTKAGSVKIKYRTGLRVLKEQQDLYKTLMKNDIDVYVCSASHTDIVKTFASNPKYGYNIPEDHVFGMETKEDKDHKKMSQWRDGFPQTQKEGKTECIKKFIAPKHKNAEPIIIEGDSGGDMNMMRDFKKAELCVIINRALDKATGEMSKKAVAEMGKPDARILLQGRDENTGEFRKSEKSILLGTDKEVLLNKDVKKKK